MAGKRKEMPDRNYYMNPYFPQLSDGVGPFNDAGQTKGLYDQFLINADKGDPSTVRARPWPDQASDITQLPKDVMNPGPDGSVDPGGTGNTTGQGGPDEPPEKRVNRAIVESQPGFVGPQEAVTKTPDNSIPGVGPLVEVDAPDRFDSKELLAGINDYFNQPTDAKVDLSSLLAYVDSQTGSDLLKGYKRPTTKEEILKERRDLMLKLGEAARKADADNEQNKIDRRDLVRKERKDEWEMKQPKKDDLGTMMAKFALQNEQARQQAATDLENRLKLLGVGHKYDIGRDAANAMWKDNDAKQPKMTTADKKSYAAELFYLRKGRQPKDNDPNDQRGLLEMQERFSSSIDNAKDQDAAIATLKTQVKGERDAAIAKKLKDEQDAAAAKAAEPGFVDSVKEWWKN